MILWHLLKTFAVNPFFDLASICLNSFCIGCIFNLYLGRIRLQKEIGNQECCILISKPSKCLSLNIYELLQGVPCVNHKNEMPIKQIQSCKYVYFPNKGSVLFVHSFTFWWISHEWPCKTILLLWPTKNYQKHIKLGFELYVHGGGYCFWYGGLIQSSELALECHGPEKRDMNTTSFLVRR